MTIIHGLALAVLAGCASVDTRVYDSARLKGISTWVLEFAYEAGSVERLQKSSGEAELKVVSAGHTPRDLQLRDDLYFILRDEYGLSLAKTTSASSGRIRLHPIHFRGGGFKLLTVTLVDGQGETLARLKIENGDRNATFKDDDEFASFSARAMADAILGR